MDLKKLSKVLKQLDEASPDANLRAIRELKAMGVDIPRTLPKHYDESRSWRARVSCVFFAVPYARDSEDAVALGIKALSDRSRIVRYRACSLLAYSLREDILPHLKVLLSHSDPSTREDARATIDAIEHKNHHWFMDREHTGRVRWTLDLEVK